MSNLQQSLLLSNHEELNRLVFEYAAARAELASHPEPLDVQEAFERVLSRPPDDEELAAATEFLTGRTTNEGMAHLLWALLTSAEFRFNH